MDQSHIACRYCKLSGYQRIYQHENGCGNNPDNLPPVTVTHRCGHQGDHQPVDASPEGGSKRIRFERDRLCKDCVIAQYRTAQAARTPEQIEEQRMYARAAFGPGQEITNVITGERYTT